MIEEKETRITDQLAQIKKVNTEFMQISNELNELRAFGNSDNERESICDLEDKISDLNKALDSKDKKISKVELQYDELRDSNKELRLQIKRYEAKIATLEKELL